MFRKLFVVIIVFALLIGGLQLFGGRDFGQVSLAWDKYNYGGDLSSFLTDIVVIFKGDKIREASLPSGKYANQIMYRWKDASGQLHVSERKPDVAEYEEIRIGDLKFQIEEGMSEEEIKAILKKKD